jgi:hypothetical protein
MLVTDINTIGNSKWASGESLLKCANVNCNEEAPHVVTYDLENGMIGKAFYCLRHLSEGQKLNPFREN